MDGRLMIRRLKEDPKVREEMRKRKRIEQQKNKGNIKEVTTFKA